MAFRYGGQGTATIGEVEAYFRKQQALYQPQALSQSAATESAAKAAKPPTENPTRKESLAGAQITIGLGFNGKVVAEWSYLHTSLKFSLYEANALEFGGQAAVFVMTQRVKNTAFQNITLKQMATKLCRAHGLNLEMEEDGPTYKYFPQHGISDYQTLLIECRRIGYRMYCKGNTLTIKQRSAKQVFVLTHGENLGTSLDVSHQAQGNSSGGARSADPSQQTTTGQRKTVVDPDTGEAVVIKEENLIGAGNAPEESTTGSAIAIVKPLTTGETDPQDSVRKNNESRVKGILASWSAPATPELLLVDPDSGMETQGFSETLDRMWVVESISFELGSGGFGASGQLCSPMVNKFPEVNETLQPSGLSSVRDASAGSNPGGLIKPINGYTLTSGFGPRGSRLHAGVDLAAPVGTNIWAAHDGTITKPAPDPNGYGSWLILTRSDGFVTRYGHLSATLVVSGDVVRQGAVIAKSGGAAGVPSSGSSSGPHLHWETRPNNVPANPESFVRL